MPVVVNTSPVAINAVNSWLGSHLVQIMFSLMFASLSDLLLCQPAWSPIKSLFTKYKTAGDKHLTCEERIWLGLSKVALDPIDFAYTTDKSLDTLNSLVAMIKPTYQHLYLSFLCGCPGGEPQRHRVGCGLQRHQLCRLRQLGGPTDCHPGLPPSAGHRPGTRKPDAASGDRGELSVRGQKHLCTL